MPQQRYEVTAPDGRTLEITGDRMPNEAELIKIFGTVGSRPASRESAPAAEPPQSEGFVSNFLKNLLPSTTPSDSPRPTRW